MEFEMTHVINPMLFYWCSVSDTAKALAIIAAIMLIIVCLVFLFVGAFHIGEAFNYGGGEDSDNYKVGAKFLNWPKSALFHWQLHSYFLRLSRAKKHCTK